MTSIDEIGRRAAAAALDEAKRTTDGEAGLAELRSGSAVRLSPASSPRSRRWLVLASAAAVIAMIGGIAVVARQQDRQTQLVPVVDTSATTEPPVSAVPSQTTITETAVTETIVPQTTSVPTSVPPAATEGSAVSYRNPPPLFEPAVFATVPVTRDPAAPSVSSSGGYPAMAVMDGSVAVVDRFGAAILVVDGQTGQVRSVPADVVTSWLPVAGPGDVIYGFPSDYQADPRFVAIALSGSRAGEEIASAPLELSPYLHGGRFGHGPTGIVDGQHDVGLQVIEYVDPLGQPTVMTEPAPLLTMTDDVVIGSDTDVTWPLQIERHPNVSRPGDNTSPPAPTQDGAAVVWMWIGPAAPSSDIDYPPPTMQVVVWLRPDGSVVWRRLPDDWYVASSDIWGTVLAHAIDDHVELAWLTPPASASEQTDVVLQPLGIGAGCVPGSCPSIAFDDNGHPVSYDPIARTLTVHESATQPRTIDVSGVSELDPSFSSLVDVGPDDVAYIVTQRVGQTDPIGDVLAIPLSGSSMGNVVQRGADIDLSGDSDLVPNTRGLVVVGCCDFAPRRPAVDARVAIPWVDRTGQPYPIEDGSELWLEFQDDGSLDVHLTRLHGTESIWTVDGVAGFRGMPLLIGTNDGGAMISLQASFDTQSESRIVVMHPDGTMDEHSIAPYLPEVLAADGSVIVFDQTVGHARVVLGD